jgi:hypothetical protein
MNLPKEISFFLMFFYKIYLLSRLGFCTFLFGLANFRLQLGLNFGQKDIAQNVSFYDCVVMNCASFDAQKMWSGVEFTRSCK